MTLSKPEDLSWNAASVELPPMPVIPPGADAMSMTIAAVLPTMEASMIANVTTLAAKENMFSGKVGAAQTAYQNADDQGGQAVGQLTEMLGQVGGQVGQLGQMAGAPMQAVGGLGGQVGSFGSLMQQAMQGGQGGQSAGAGASGVPAAQGADERTAQQDQREAQQNEREDQQDHREAALDARDAQQGYAAEAGPAPVAPPEHGKSADGEDLARRM